MNRFRRSLALLLVFAMVFTTFAAVTVSAQTFSDVSGHWAEALIDKWSASGVINGYEDGTFRPDDNITRAELAKVISVAKGYTEEAAISFSDVSEDDWFTPSLKKCVAKGVIGGYEDGTFRPDAYVNREEAATMIVRAYNINATALLSFTDSADISPWAQNAVTALVGANVINGYEDGSFGPKNSITRAELVKMLDGAASAEILFPQATDSTGGTNSVGTIGNLGGFHGSGSTSGGGGGGSTTSRSYNVTFDANGGSFANGRTSQSVSVSQNMVIGSRVSDPTKEGMKFDGWYTSRDAADQLIASKKWSLNTDKVTKSMTLYAGWYVEGDVTVTFESCGGSAVAAQTVQSGNLAAEPAAPTRANYTFTGWYTDNKATKKFDFANTTIRKNTTLYAGWSLNADYTGAEITLPDETDPESNLKTGSIVAVPPTAIAGETVKMSITAPEGFTLEGIKSITYLASVTEGETTTEQTATIASSAIKYNKETDTYSFTMPTNAIGNVKVIPRFEEVIPTGSPEPTSEPTATPEPTPTQDPKDMPTYYFSNETFNKYDTENKVPANTEIGGLTLSGASAIGESSKVFAGSGYTYTRTLKSGKATVKFKVLTSCDITIDAVSAKSSVDREFTVKADSQTLNTFTCIGGETPTFEVKYTGTGGVISIVPADGINIYGINVKYTGTIPSAVPTSTPSAAPTQTPAVSALKPQESAKIWMAEEGFGELFAHSPGDSSIKFDVTDVNMNNLYLWSSRGTEPINYEDMYEYQGSPQYYNFSDGNVLASKILNFRPGTELEFVPSATKSGKLKLYYGGKDPNSELVTVKQGADETVGATNEAGDIVEVNVKPKDNVNIVSLANGWLFAVAYIPDGTTLDPIKPSVDPSKEYTVKVDEKVTGGTVELVKPAEASAAPSTAPTAEASAVPSEVPTAEPPAGDYIVSDPITTEKTWTFETDKLADMLDTFTVDEGADKGIKDKTYFKGNTKYENLVIYAEKGTQPSENAKVTGKVVEVDSNKKTINEVSYTHRLKLGGAGTDNGAESTRMLTFMPGAAGTVTIAAAHASSSGDPRTLNVMQGETNIDGGFTLAPGEVSSKTFTVEANKIVRIYGAAAVNIYGITFAPTAAASTETAEAAEGETFVKELTAKAGDTIKVKAVPTNTGDKVIMYSEPSVEFVLDKDGYYTFTMPGSDITVGALFGDVAPPSNLPGGLTAISGAYTFIAQDFVSAAVPSGEQLVDNGKVLLSGGNKFSASKGSNTIGEVEATNCLGLKYKTYLAFAPAQNSTVTVYSQNHATRGIGVGTALGSIDIMAPTIGQNVISFDVSANQVVYLSGYEPTVDNPIAGGDLYLAGFTVTPK